MYNLLPNTTTATELQRNYRKVVERAKKTKKPLIVLSNNKPEGIYMDYEAFRKEQKKPTSEVTNAKSKSGFDGLFGSWTKEEADKFDRIIEDAFEQVSPEDWK